MCYSRSSERHCCKVEIGGGRKEARIRLSGLLSSFSTQPLEVSNSFINLVSILNQKGKHSLRHHSFHPHLSRQAFRATRPTSLRHCLKALRVFIKYLSGPLYSLLKSSVDCISQDIVDHRRGAEGMFLLLCHLQPPERSHSRSFGSLNFLTTTFSDPFG